MKGDDCGFTTEVVDDADGIFRCERCFDQNVSKFERSRCGKLHSHARDDFALDIFTPDFASSNFPFH